MGPAITIARKELLSLLVSPASYALLSGYLLLLAFFFFNLLVAFQVRVSRTAAAAAVGAVEAPNLNEWIIAPYLHTIALILIVLLPIFTMRSFAEERKNRTLEYLMTAPIGRGQVVLGKYAAAVIVAGVLILSSGIFPLLLCVYGNPETGPVISGFAGLLVYAAAFAATGIAVSAWSQTQLVACVAGVLTNLLLYGLSGAADNLSGASADVVRAFSPKLHLTNFIDGLVTSSGLVFFSTIIAIALLFAARALAVFRYRL